MKWFFALLLLPACVNAQDNDQPAIQKLLDESVVAWNAGNLDKFMEDYWQSDSLMFIGKTGVVYGYEATLARYHRTYHDRDAMGTLGFDSLSFKRLAPDYYWVLGKWTLKRTKDQPGGWFTLLFRRIGKVWKIIADHTS